MVLERPANPRRGPGGWRPGRAYAVASAALVAAVALRWLLDPLMGDSLPLVTLFGAVALAAWVGGWRPAVGVTLVGYAACSYLFIPPRGALDLSITETQVGLASYFFTCGLIIAIGEAMHRAERRAAERREVLRVTLASIGDAVITTDIEGRVTFLNAVAQALTGWTHTDALGRPLEEVFRIVAEDDRRPLESPALRALRDGRTVGLQNHTLLLDRQGGERSIDDSAAPIRDDAGRVSGCVLIFRDVSARRRFELAEAERQLDTRRLAAIVETSDDAIVSKTLDGIIRTWNAGAERLFGHTAAEAVGRHISLVIPPDRLAEEDQILASLRAGERVDHFETRRRRRDGSLVDVSLTISPLKDDAGNVVGASKIARDITDRKRSEAERQQFATLIENSTDFVGICDPAGVPVFINAAGLRLVGLASLEEARRTNLRDFFFPEDQARVMDRFLPEVAASGHGEIEVRFRNFETGEARWMAYKVVTLADAGGQVTAFATVSQDVTERRRLEDDLRKLASDLADADQRKDEFLATLSHELRNPLAPMRNMLEVLRRTGPDAAAREHALDIVDRQLGQLVRLVDDLLDLSRITHNRIELRLAPLDLVPVLEQALRASAPLADAAGITLERRLPATPLPVNGDAVRLAQVFGNLLSNACKFTPRGGKVTLAAEATAGEVRVTVVDTGAGIPPEALERIFDMFAQLDRSLERNQGGLGIGLTLVKRLVGMHAGTVAASSAGEGRGSTFVVRLPLQDAVAASPATRRPPPAAAVAPRRILVVDDNRDAAESLLLLLGIQGHRVFEAHDGEAAFAAAEEHRPDVVLLDLGLPLVNGYEVCRRIREQPWGRSVVLIALTGWGQEEDRRRTRAAGFDGHLVKPVDFPELLALLARLPAAGTARD